MIGVLALQGGFEEHIQVLTKLGADCLELRQRADLAGTKIDGLILPGGESTVIGKLLRETGLFAPLKDMISQGLPVFGTCAGMILLAKRLDNDSHTIFEAIDITVRRNAFGRQLGSFHKEAEVRGLGKLPMTFIRAPFITEAAADVEILSVVNGVMVAARQNKVLVTAFHPELTEDTRMHEYFLSMI
jgi:5'-phosphate synthase pdxT subunit